MQAGRSVWLMLGLGLAGTGCGPQPVTTPSVALAGQLAAAEVRCEPARIDFGTAAAREHLLRGWYQDERSHRADRTFVWSRGPRSDLAFYVSARRSLTIEVEVLPYRAPGLPDQSLEVAVNSHRIAELRLRRGWNSYRIELPERAVVVGDNRLSFEYRHSWMPSEVQADSSDTRQLAVAWDWLEIRETSGAWPTATSSDDALRVPTGCRIDFFVQVPDQGLMTMAGIEVEGGGEHPPELRITATSEANDENTLAVIRERRSQIELGLGAGGLLRLRLQAVGVPGASFLLKGTRVPTYQRTDRRADSESRLDAATEGPPPNVIVYLVDALRPDHLGCYGYRRATSPRLDLLAAEGVVFEDAIAQSSWTKAAVASLMTGVSPPTHGAHGPEDTLPEDLPTLAEHLRDAGYRTGAWVANAYVGSRFGFDRGFETFVSLKHTVGDSAEIHRRLLPWLDAQSADRPFFLFVHAIDPHAPYAPPEPFRQRLAPEVADPAVGRVDRVRTLVRGEVVASPELERDLRALYDAEIAFNDTSFGDLMDALRARGFYRDSLVVFVSDHGEAFGEHGSWTHGLDLYEESIRIPLVVRFPEGRFRGRRVATTVAQTDVLPTLLEMAGITPPPFLEGVSLLFHVSAGAHSSDRPVVSFLDYWGRSGAAVILGEWKLIVPRSELFGTEPELYHRIDDPGETKNLATRRPIRAGLLGSVLRDRMATVRRSVRVPLDRDTRQELRALGYIE